MSNYFKSFFDKYLTQVEKIEKDDQFPKYFYEQFLSGNNEIYHKNVREVKIFDEEWIDTVESYFPSINNIINDPKSGLKYEDEVVLVEKAKKIGPNTVKYLASHSEDIKEIDEKGNVIPKKLLTTRSDIEYATYENRFVMTLIERIYFFVRNRYELIKENVESFQRTRLIMNSEFPYNGKEVKVNLDVVIKEDLEDKSINEHNYKLLQRVENLNKLVSSFYRSTFMQELTKASKVRSPIMKTSVIQKNVNYQNAYLLWLFLDKYDTLAYDLQVEEKSLKLSAQYLNNIERLALINFATIAFEENRNNSEYNIIPGNKFEVKGFRQKAFHPNDLLENPIYLQVESNLANEYYLNQFKELFEKRIEEHNEDVKLNDTALKRSMRDLQEITNNLYNAYFEFEIDEDIFKRLIKKENPINQIENLKNKLHYAEIIRDVKEVDYNEQLRLERRLIKQLIDLDKIIVKAANNSKLITAKDLKTQILTENRKKEILKKDALLKKYLEQVRENRKKLDQEKKEAIERIYELEKKLKEEEVLYLKQVKENLKLQHQERINRLTNDFDNKLRDLKEKYKKESKNQKLRVNKSIDQVKVNHKKTLKDIEKEIQKAITQKEVLYEDLLNQKLLEFEIALKNNSYFEKDSLDD